MKLCINGLVRDCRSSIDNTLELLQSCSRHWYNTIATGLGRIQSSNKKKTSHIPPPLVSFGMSVFLGFFEDVWNIPCYDGIATALKSWGFFCFFAQRCTCCTPRTYNFVPAMYHLHWLMLCYKAAENANENKMHFWFFFLFHSLYFLIFS